MHFWRESCEIKGGNFGDACNVLLNSLVDGQKDLKEDKRNFIFGSHLRYVTENKKCCQYCSSQHSNRAS